MVLYLYKPVYINESSYAIAKKVGYEEHFLTGATGYVGSGIAQALQRAGYEVVGLTRSDAGVAHLQKQDIQPLLGGRPALAGTAAACSRASAKK